AATIHDTRCAMHDSRVSRLSSVAVMAVSTGRGANRPIAPSCGYFARGCAALICGAVRMRRQLSPKPPAAPSARAISATVVIRTVRERGGGTGVYSGNKTSAAGCCEGSVCGAPGAMTDARRGGCPYVPPPLVVGTIVDRRCGFGDGGGAAGKTIVDRRRIGKADWAGDCGPPYGPLVCGSAGGATAS